MYGLYYSYINKNKYIKRDASKEIANYLKPLAKNDFTISDTLSFPDMLKQLITVKNMRTFFMMQSHFL